ncbi:MAG TPA: hypothetical protein ENN75_02760, partial [candidate division Zixibacteria bacterium]|nr:hypothetical protein [candidate division Zixibacteria bacterium]
MVKRRKNKSLLGDWGELIRWKNTLVALGCVFVGLRLGETMVEIPARQILYLVVGLIFAGGNVVNDFVDIPSDKIAHPRRPLPSGTIKPKTAFIAGLAIITAGLLFNLAGMHYYGMIPTIIGVFAAVAILFYDFLGSRIPLVGNLVIALLAGGVFLFVGTAQGLTQAHIYAAGFSALITLAREIIKDIADRPADEKVGIRTIPAVIGDKRAAVLASACMATIIPLTIVPYFTGVFNEWYLGPMILFVLLPIVLLALLLPSNISPKKASKYARDLKWVILGGLFSL